VDAGCGGVRLVEDGYVGDQLADGRAVGLSEADGDLVGARNLGRGDVAHGRGDPRDVTEALDGEDDVLRRQGRTVVEHEAVADGEPEGGCVDELPTRRHARHELEVLVEHDDPVVDVVHGDGG